MSWEDSYVPSQRTGGKSNQAPRLSDEEKERMREEIAAVKELTSRECRRIALKFGVTNGTVRHYAKKANPNAFPRSNPTLPAKPKYKKVHFKTGQPCLTNDEMKLICSDYLRRFKAELDAGNIQCRNANEADKFIRLLKFLDGEADSRKEVKQSFGIEMLQDFINNTPALPDHSDPALTGAIEVKPLVDEIPEELSGRRRVPERAAEPPPPAAPARREPVSDDDNEDEEQGERDWFGSV